MIPRVVVLRTDQEKTVGLIGMRPVPPETVFVFADVREGTLFHALGVLEPFDLVFVDPLQRVLLSRRMTPGVDGLVAPPGTAQAWESKAGVLLGKRRL